MSKAIEGAALIGAAVGMEVGAAIFAPDLLFTPMFQHLAVGLALGGVSMEAGAIAGALTSNRGMNITTRQAAALRQVIYGTQRVGGVTVYESTTGSSHDQYNYVIVLAGHEIEAIENLYLDGRQVYWQGSGVGWCVRNGVGFGGVADGANHTGPDGVQYNFGGTGHSGLYCEVRFGDQTDPFGTNSPGVATWTGTPTSVIGGLTANDPNWASDGMGHAPWLGGCAYVYLKIEANSSLFPQPPEIKFTVRGKNNIYDPRTSTTGFTNNWALITADVISDPVFGLGDSSINQAQLIAAANVCDEQVVVETLTPLGTTESRYCTDYHADASVGAGDLLAAMMPGAAGRISRVGGEWYIFPAYWQGPTGFVDSNSLTAAPSWKPYRSIRDLFNRVRGTYTAPNYPFSVAGNLYDSNGFYNGMIENNFPFAFQQTNYPEYACDTLHGYASDQYLTEDGGRQLVKELGLQTVLSVTQCQRVAKITLLRNRQQGSGTLTMSLPQYTLQPCDTLQMTFPEFGWTEKTLEVTSIAFNCEQQQTSTGEKAMAIMLTVGVQETDSSVYSWNPATDELTVYDVPALPSQQSRYPAPPTSMSLTSSLATALVGLDGIVHPRVEVQWDTPQDVLVTGIQIAYQLAPPGGSVGPWLYWGTVDASINLAYVEGVVSGQTYNFRIRSIRPNGATSVWVEIDGFTVGTVLSVLTQLPLAQSSLTTVAYSSGTASIFGVPFEASVGNQTISVAPSNYPITGLNQNQLYYLYYVDSTFSGGAVTAVATQNTADFLNKPGYFYIGSIVTALYSSTGGTGGGGGSITGSWYPSTYADLQNGATNSTANPAAPYSLDPTQYATLYGSQYDTGGGTYEAFTDCIVYSGFPSVSPTSTSLYGLIDVITADTYGLGGQYTVEISTDGGAHWTLVQTVTSSGGVTGTLPTSATSGSTNLSNVQVRVTASPNTGAGTNLFGIKIYDLHLA